MPFIRRKGSKDRDTYDRAFYTRARWRKLRAAVLRNEPLCRACNEAGRVRAADMVDHIKTRRDRPDLEYDVSNLQPLCNSCHAKKSAKERKNI